MKSKQHEFIDVVVDISENKTSTNGILVLHPIQDEYQRELHFSIKTRWKKISNEKTFFDGSSGTSKRRDQRRTKLRAHFLPPQSDVALVRFFISYAKYVTAEEKKAEQAETNEYIC